MFLAELSVFFYPSIAGLCVHCWAMRGGVYSAPSTCGLTRGRLWTILLVVMDMRGVAQCCTRATRRTVFGARLPCCTGKSLLISRGVRSFASCDDKGKRVALYPMARYQPLAGCVPTAPHLDSRDTQERALAGQRSTRQEPCHRSTAGLRAGRDDGRTRARATCANTKGGAYLRGPDVQAPARHPMANHYRTSPQAVWSRCERRVAVYSPGWGWEWGMGCRRSRKATQYSGPARALCVASSCPPANARKAA